MCNGRLIQGLCIATLAISISGCEAIGEFLRPRTVEVQLVNDSDFAVEISLFTSDEQDIPESLITELGTESQYTVPSKETRTFTRSCDDLQAIIIDDADLLVIGALGPEANTDVLRDGDEFSCGETIIFTFDHSAAITDFDVTVSYDDQSF